MDSLRSSTAPKKHLVDSQRISTPLLGWFSTDLEREAWVNTKAKPGEVGRALWQSFGSDNGKSRRSHLADYVLSK